MRRPRAKDRAEARVVVVDDSAVFLDAAGQVIDATPGFTAAALLSSANGLLARLQRRPADVVLLDVRMPGTDGVTVARELAGLSHPPTIVLLSADECPAIAADPAAHGAVDFIPKETFRPAVLQALRPPRVDDG